MFGKQAKIFLPRHFNRLLRVAGKGKFPERDRLIVLLATRAGLRACEIARLTWGMVLDANGQVSPTLDVRGSIAKRGSGRRVPMHPELRRALALPGAGENGHVVTARRAALGDGHAVALQTAEGKIIKEQKTQLERGRSSGRKHGGSRGNLIHRVAAEVGRLKQPGNKRTAQRHQRTCRPQPRCQVMG